METQSQLELYPLSGHVLNCIPDSASRPFPLRSLWTHKISSSPPGIQFVARDRSDTAFCFSVVLICDGRDLFVLTRESDVKQVEKKVLESSLKVKVIRW